MISRKNASGMKARLWGAMKIGILFLLASRVTDSAMQRIIETAAGSWSIDSRCIGYPTNVVKLDDGNLLITDSFRNVIIKTDSIGQVTVVAGGNGPGYSGDGGRATQARLNNPSNAISDGKGGILIADTENNRIRQVDASGIITTIVGNGVYNYSGDGGPAAQASISEPFGLALDDAGGFYFLDKNYSRVRHVDVSGIIETVAGNGQVGFSGDGGLAINAEFNYPLGIASDGAGGFLIADYGNQRVRRVDAKGIITTIAGNGQYGFSGDGGLATEASLDEPKGVSSDGTGGFYIADSWNNRIRRVDANGIITTVAGSGGISYTAGGYSGDGGPAVQAQLNYPQNVASDGNGGFLIADSQNSRIRHVDANGIITTVAGNGQYGFSGDGGPADQAELAYPYGVSSDGEGGFLIADTYNQRIRRVSADGIITTVAGNGQYGFSGDGGPATEAQLNCPRSVSPDGAGGFYIADTWNNRIRRVDTNGIITTVAGNGEGGLYAANDVGDGSIAVNAWLNRPQRVKSDGSGGFFIADTYHFRIRRVGADGIITTVAGNGIWGFSGNGGPALQAQLGYPDGVTPDGVGGFFFSDTYNNQVRRVSADGIISSVAGRGTPEWYGEIFSGNEGPAVLAQIGNPQGISLDGTGGILFVDTYNQRIHRVDTNGVITTLAGNGLNGFSGDGGLAVQASLGYPFDVASDGHGSFYIADTYNNRIRRVRAPEISPNNHPPVASDQTVSVEEYASVDITLSAQDADGDALSYFVTQAPAHGSITGGDAHRRYSPQPGFSGQDSFQFRARDASDYSLPALVTITVSEKAFSPGMIVTVAGGGYPESNSVVEPVAVALDENRDALISDSYNKAILKADAEGRITVVAGGNGSGYSGDGGPAALAQISDPFGVSPDGTGGFFIADSGNDRIRHVDSSGIIETVAGGGNPPNGLGDGGLAVQAQLAHPKGVSSDGAGGFFIADTDHHRIRRVDAKGIITTVAGNGVGIFAGDGGLATKAQIVQPYEAISDKMGGFFIADSGDNRIRHVDASGIISTVAGNGAFNSVLGDGGLAIHANLSFPQSIALDESGGFLIADTYHYRIRRVDAKGVITTVAGDGNLYYMRDGDLAINASISPQGVASDGKGGFYIPDSLNHRIYQTDVNGIISTFAGNGGWNFSGDGESAIQAQLSEPIGVTPDGAGGFLIADSYNKRIRRVDASGIIATVAGGYGGYIDGDPAILSGLAEPTEVSPDGAGGYYIVDTGPCLIYHVDANGIIWKFAGGNGYGFSGDGGLAVNAKLAYPQGAASDGAGGVYIADTSNNLIRRVDASGIITTVAGGGKLSNYLGDGGPALQANLYSPYRIAPDGAGGIYIADSGVNRIRRLNAKGIITTVAGNGGQGFSGDGGLATQAELNQPQGVTPDGGGGLFIADTGNHRIRHVDSRGYISTLAGDGTTGFYGDGGPALQARLDSPTSVALTGNGLLIADSHNNRIREILFAGAGVNHPPVAGDQTVSVEQFDKANVTLAAQDSDGDPLTYFITQPPTHGALSGTAPNLIYAPYPSYVGQDSFQYVASDFVSSSAVTTVTIVVKERPITPNEIVTVAGDGSQGFSGDDGLASRASLGGPTQASPDGSGGFLVADALNGRIRRIDASGVVTTVAGSGADGFSGDGGSALTAKLSHPTGVSSDGAGGFLITDYGNHRIRRVDAGGIIATVAGSGTQGFSGDGGSATKARLSYPMAAKPDDAGGFFVADWGNHRIRRVSASGIISTVAGGGSPPDGLGDGGFATKAQLSYPTDAASDGSGGFYVADYGDHRIRHVGMRGIIATVAGSGASGFSGDGGLATKARLAHPTGVAPDGTGGFLIADRDNHRVRRVDASGYISTVAGGGNPADGLGDGGLATEAALKLPTGVSSDGAGGFLVADWGDNRVRRIFDARFVNPLRRESIRAKAKGKAGR